MAEDLLIGRGIESFSIADDEDENKLVIGLDFGTTYSGVAYLFTGTEKPESIAITDWPGVPGANRPKVPTLIRYDNSSERPYTWGYELESSHDVNKIVGIKLLLDPDHPKPLYVPQSNTKAELQNLGKSAVDVAADYIATIYKHALSKIEAAWPEEYIKKLPKKFILSVPAVWSDKAKNSTMEVSNLSLPYFSEAWLIGLIPKAAKKAGFYPVELIKEPEAAALYTLHTLKDKARNVRTACQTVYCSNISQGRRCLCPLRCWRRNG